MTTWQRKIRNVGGDPGLYESVLELVGDTFSRIPVTGDQARWLVELTELGVIEQKRVHENRSNGTINRIYCLYRRTQ